MFSPTQFHNGLPPLLMRLKRLKPVAVDVIQSVKNCVLHRGGKSREGEREKVDQGVMMDDGATVLLTSGAMHMTPPMPNSLLRAATALRSAASDSKPTPPSVPSCTPASPRTAVLIQRGQRMGSPAYPSPSLHASQVHDMAVPVGCPSGGHLTSGSGSGTESEDDGGHGGVMHMEVDVGGMEVCQGHNTRCAGCSITAYEDTNTESGSESDVVRSHFKPEARMSALSTQSARESLKVEYIKLNKFMLARGSRHGADDVMANVGQGSDMSISQGDPSSDSGFMYEDGGVGGGQSCKCRTMPKKGNKSLTYSMHKNARVIARGQQEGFNEDINIILDMIEKHCEEVSAKWKKSKQTVMHAVKTEVTSWLRGDKLGVD
ncbi:hypothetical protein BU17DRAFT_69663 [Hysterangium stoloniferum]|nr:hypothetical protein BU17DRAFT_69663 [Hysterangium stoloniferum]